MEGHTEWQKQCLIIYESEVTISHNEHGILWEYMHRKLFLLERVLTSQSDILKLQTFRPLYMLKWSCSLWATVRMSSRKQYLPPIYPPVFQIIYSPQLTGAQPPPKTDHHLQQQHQQRCKSAVMHFVNRQPKSTGPMFSHSLGHQF